MGHAATSTTRPLTRTAGNTSSIGDARSLARDDWSFESDDDLFTAPFVDVDEDRDDPVPHRYVHGGFSGTDTLFSLYLPDVEAYRGRFFQHVTPFPQSENLGPSDPLAHNKIAFAHASGAYFVETNGGGARAGDPFAGVDPTIAAYRANAAAARFSRSVAQAVYGEHRIYGYLYGGSGGGYRTIGAAENTVGAWDGFAPHVIGSSMAIPNVFCVRMHALRVLRDRFPDIVDAYDVGGDPDSLQLTVEERSAFDEVTRMGFPPRSWFGWKTLDLHGFSALYPGVIAADPTYTTDFWTVDGYLGADPRSSVHRDRVQLRTTVAELVPEETDPPEPASGGVDESFKHAEETEHRRVVAVRLGQAPHGWILGAELHVVSGSAAGAVIRLSGVDGDLALVEQWDGVLPAGFGAGDEVVLDNSSFLAVQTYHRHQVPGPGFPVWDQFRDDNGDPLYPQRPMLLGPLMSQGATGAEMTGSITGKMIIVEAGLDREAFPWQVDWYRRLVESRLGPATQDQLRVWIVENALHGDVGPQEFPGHTVSYLGVLETALRQLAAWVEDGVEPSSTTTYEVVDGQVLLPQTAAGRGGVQPVAALAVNGLARTEVAIGEPVTVQLEAQAVEGLVVDVSDVVTTPAGEDRIGDPMRFEPATSVSLTWNRSFDEPGTYFLAARVTAQTGADAASRYARAENVVRARVVVHG